jgi:elongator complex protein 4
MVGAWVFANLWFSVLSKRGVSTNLDIRSIISTMSSFKRKTTKQPSHPPGTYQSPSSHSTTITSTGIPSLDDILGGGLPLSCTLLVLAPDSHSIYGELVQKYFVSQGLTCGQRVCVVDNYAQEFVQECMWLPGGSGPPLALTTAEDEDETASQLDHKIKIAWRYEQMKKFQTTIPFSTWYVSSL